jgi:hypothetical protein
VKVSLSTLLSAHVCKENLENFMNLRLQQSPLKCQSPPYLTYLRDTQVFYRAILSPLVEDSSTHIPGHYN